MQGAFNHGMVQPSRLRSAARRGIELAASLARVPPAGLRGTLDDRASDALPVILIFQPGNDEAAIQRTVDAIPALCAAALVRIVLVLDRPHLAIVRRGGVAVELLPDRAAFERRHRDMSWPQLVEHRLALLQEDYTAAAIMQVSTEGLSAAEIPTLAAVLRSDRRLRRDQVFWRRWLAALVGGVDPPVGRQPAPRHRVGASIRALVDFRFK